MNAPAGIRYLIDSPPPPGVLLDVAPGVRWLRMPLPFSLDHINLWLIDEGDRVAIVDCGIADERTRQLWQALFDGPLRGREVSRVIVTHFHPDHIGNAAWLCERAGVMMHVAQAEYLLAHATCAQVAGYTDVALREFFRGHGLDDSRSDALLEAPGSSYRRMVPDVPTHYRRIIEGEPIALGSDLWCPIRGDGHSPEHMMLHRQADRVLIAGDMVLPRISTNVSVHASQPDSDPLGDFLRSLERYRVLDPETLVLPSHGLPFRGLHVRIDALQAHHTARLDELTQACGTAQTAAELMSTLFRRPLDGHQIWFAIGETLAHLNHLVHGGHVVRVLDGDGITRFVRV